jgi:hypothetical protein
MNNNNQRCSLLQLCHSLAFALPRQALLHHQHNPALKNADSTIWHSLGFSLRKQWAVRETASTLRRLMCAKLRDDLQDQDDEFDLFSNQDYEGDGFTLQQQYARAGLPDANTHLADSYNASWCFPIAQSNLHGNIHMLVVNNYTEEDQSIRLVVMNDGQPDNTHVVTDLAEIRAIKRNNLTHTDDAVWILCMGGNNYYGLNPHDFIVGGLETDTHFNGQWMENKTQLLHALQSPINVALAGYLPITVPFERMDHSTSYFAPDPDVPGLVSIAPFESALGLGVDINEFAFQHVDIDKVFLQGACLDTLFKHCFSPLASVNMGGNHNLPIPEFGKELSRQLWVEITYTPYILIKREHTDIARDLLGRRIFRFIRQSQSGNFDDGSNYSINPQVLRAFLDELKRTVNEIEQESFQIIFYVFGMQTPANGQIIDHAINDFIHNHYNVVVDIATTFNQQPLGSLNGKDGHVVLFKAKPTTGANGEKHKYRIPDQHPSMSFAQGLRCGDPNAYGGCTWNKLAVRYTKKNTIFHGKCLFISFLSFLCRVY